MTLQGEGRSPCGSDYFEMCLFHRQRTNLAWIRCSACHGIFKFGTEICKYFPSWSKYPWMHQALRPLLSLPGACSSEMWSEIIKGCAGLMLNWRGEGLENLDLLRWSFLHHHPFQPTGMAFLQHHWHIVKKRHFILSSHLGEIFFPCLICTYQPVFSNTAFSVPLLSFCGLWGNRVSPFYTCWFR